MSVSIVAIDASVLCRSRYNCSENSAKMRGKAAPIAITDRLPLDHSEINIDNRAISFSKQLAKPNMKCYIKSAPNQQINLT